MNTQSSAGTGSLKRIMPGLIMGLLTSIIGFVSLAVTPADLLTQIAVFSATGLVGAFLTVICLLPFLPTAQPAACLDRHNRLQRFYRSHGSRLNHRGMRLLVPVVVAMLAISLPWLINPNDDVRVLGQGNSELIDNTEVIQQQTGNVGAPYFLFIQAPDTETVLQIEESIRVRLQPLVEQQIVDGMTAVADFIPSRQRQRHNRQLIREVLYPRATERLNAATGISVSAPNEITLLEPDPGTLAHLPTLQTLMMTEHPGSQMVRLYGVTNTDRVNAALAGLSGVQLVNPATTISQALGSYRLWAYKSLGLLLAGVALLLVARYGFRQAPFVLLAPVSGILMALLAAPLLGVTHNFFTTMALFLVFAIGADYALFLRESAAQPHGRQTYLAICLSLLSSLLAFGLLASSSIPLVRDLGVVIALGLSAAWLFAPLAASSAQSSTRSTVIND